MIQFIQNSRFFIIAATFLLFLACSSNQPVSKATSTAAPAAASVPKNEATNISSLKQIRSILIVPTNFQAGIGAKAGAPILNTYQADLLDTALNRDFKLFSGLEVVNLETLKSSSSKDLRESASIAKNIKDIYTLAQKADISSLLLVRVNRLQERSGSVYGSNQLAKLGFEVEIIDLGSKNSLWSDSFEKDDRPKPLISFEDGRLAKLGFVSLEELVNEGTNTIAKSFARQRQQAFTQN